MLAESFYQRMWCIKCRFIRIPHSFFFSLSLSTPHICHLSIYLTTKNSVNPAKPYFDWLLPQQVSPSLNASRCCSPFSFFYFFIFFCPLISVISSLVSRPNRDIQHLWFTEAAMYNSGAIRPSNEVTLRQTPGFWSHSSSCSCFSPPWRELALAAVGAPLPADARLQSQMTHIVCSLRWNLQLIDTKFNTIKKELAPVETLSHCIHVLKILKSIL